DCLPDRFLTLLLDCAVRCDVGKCSKGGSFRPTGTPWTRRLCDFLYAGSDTLTSRNSSPGSKVDSAQPDVLGDPYDGRVWTRSNCHSRESPGAACDAPDDAHAGTLWRNGLGSAPDRSPEGAFQLVRMRPDFACYRGCLGGG